MTQPFTAGSEAFADLRNALPFRGKLHRWEHARYAVQTLAELAVESYQPEGIFQMSAKAAGFEGSVLLRATKTDAEAQVAWGGGIAVVGFRGSELPKGADWRANLRDWKADVMSAWRRPWPPYLPPGVVAGVGFRNQIVDILPQLLFTLGKLKEDNDGKLEVFICGHSLGAADATLAVPALRAEEFEVPLAVAVESPRVFDEASALWYDDNFKNSAATTTYRVSNVEDGVPDIVTRVPKGWHVGTPITMTEEWLSTRPEEWNELCESNPIPALARWRVFSRAAAGTRAHGGRRVVRRMRKHIRPIREQLTEPMTRDPRWVGFPDPEEPGGVIGATSKEPNA